ncbi:TetR/AcrR family transcriptional regulator [Pedobacter cryoconitis]|uniref:TetR/AcrR family transcriptional repressor of nem operon n=1 Tax=Pedobacter cryoconitis TaxID=188932 RepID=A0A7X0J4T4_9SPHI|nr:TetR/AcrR family transcriptional regulator [Pedobacter cryoconitis]MBB6499827.1 TetR/AcrR family transcriptional repressor of nem operon [Pedobacter cryoconitis]
MARSKEFDPTEKLVKARDLFWEKGYHVTSMQDLVSEMQVNRRSMYDTYGDKYKLFTESLQSYALETYSEYKLAALGEESPLKAIELIVYKAIARSFEEKKVCMVVKSSFEVAPLDPGVRELLKQLTQRLIFIFEDLIIKGQQAGEISLKKDAKRAAQFMVGSFAGLWQMQALFDDREMVEQMAKQNIESLK